MTFMWVEMIRKHPTERVRTKRKRKKRGEKERSQILPMVYAQNARGNLSEPSKQIER